ncbi:MAG: hypothetical protein LBV47_05675 [Bacteroidales bacterium]|nr:hypothetical protein [Bacteroidales bacterium]
MRTIVKNTAFEGIKYTQYTQIPPAVISKVTVGRTVKHDSLLAQPAQRPKSLNINM